MSGNTSTWPLPNPRSFYLESAVHGYVWTGFWDGLHHYKKEFRHIACTEEDIENDELPTMLAQGVSRITTTGLLEERFAHSRTSEKLSFCVDCGTGYHIDSQGRVKCNGSVILRCPWCRPDSRPWTNGR